jgi:t-SNARE complex subunit (syntaxin)
MLVNTQRAKESLNQIEARHHDILKLENSMKELHNMFRDLAMLVADQVKFLSTIFKNFEFVSRGK